MTHTDFLVRFFKIRLKQECILNNSEKLLDRVQAIANLAMALGKVNRATTHPDGTWETDTTHTIMLALVAADIAQDLNLDRGDVLALALVHDLVEAYAGDTNTLRELSIDESNQKKEREKAALARIRKDLSDSQWIIDLIDRYEAQDDPASRAVRYLDKIMPKLTHLLNGCRSVKESNMSCSELIQRHTKQGIKLRMQYPEFDMLAELFDAACAASEEAYKLNIDYLE